LKLKCQWLDTMLFGLGLKMLLVAEAEKFSVQWNRSVLESPVNRTFNSLWSQIYTILYKQPL